jgi:pyruvate dehydrogenase E2 component (dihydrolipoamide acetyltransferase)
MDAPQKSSAAKSAPAFTSRPDPQVSGLNTGLQVSSMEAEPLRPSGKASPRARKLAEKEALPLPASGSGPGARIIERDVSAALLSMSRLTAAAKASLKAPGLSGGGSGIGGRLTLEDMLKGADLAAPMGQPAVIEGGYTDTPLKSVRKIIADRMSASLAESAQLTLNTSAGASKLKEIRSRYKETTGEEAQITINDLVLFAVSRTLKSFPYMNAHKYGDTIRIFQRVHLGIAVDTPRGLMVPVIRNASQLSLKEISSEAKQLALSCQENKINPDDLSGSTFTVSNLGNLGITSFTPILNVPEVAILGVCAMEIKPVFNEKQDKVSNNAKQVSYEPFIGFSLTINHQAVDGAPAARFLQGLVEAIENIDTFLF